MCDSVGLQHERNAGNFTMSKLNTTFHADVLMSRILYKYVRMLLWTADTCFLEDIIFTILPLLMVWGKLNSSEIMEHSSYGPFSSQVGLRAEEKAISLVCTTKSISKNYDGIFALSPNQGVIDLVWSAWRSNFGENPLWGRMTLSDKRFVSYNRTICSPNAQDTRRSMVRSATNGLVL